MDGNVPEPARPPRPRVGSSGEDNGAQKAVSSEAMPPPPAPSASAEEELETRSSRSASTASRTNRLSLTLPIAPPTAYPSRPTPSAINTGSYPPTPVDTPSLMSPSEPTDVITAIAAQERRVLELREELSRAEHELSRLKKQWAHQEAYKKKAEVRRTEPLRSLASQAVEAPANLDDPLVRRSVELDRRKALLLGQKTPGTPTQGRRRVFEGGHARTLSLLSPTKSDTFSVHEDQADDVSVKSPSRESKELDSHFYQSLSRYAPIGPGHLAKRASWAPRSVHQMSGLKQVADDFKAGLWTFVEDLRQATVGDEPITGVGLPMRGIDGNSRGTHGGSSPGEDQDTIRASGSSSRPHVAKAFDPSSTPPAKSSPTDPASKEKKGGSSSSKQTRKSSSQSDKKNKHFSWTPLTVDSFDDNDWSNWDSPAPATKSPRWSGSTVNGDMIPVIPEKGDENGTPLTSEPSAENTTSPGTASATKLEELVWPAALKGLTPGNLKRTATDFMKEWEKSLSPLAEAAPAVPVGASLKEKSV